jgi:hypothetical protein
LKKYKENAEKVFSFLSSPRPAPAAVVQVEPRRKQDDEPVEF